ncbi:hypothetical protein [Xylophilus sp. GOD-11R]|uniref:hypothetical protein n=1 Tax=Xylophilus sp. GOD-11R TaxID=3089814 RepID=UPI00298C871B|nr:hypothetical protein [Xylophilus sp. GOD-11R]WPB56150.1 hypothetical protein R9X41_18675 [Xylophilus sp. GOD-11R]
MNTMTRWTLAVPAAPAAPASMFSHRLPAVLLAAACWTIASPALADAVRDFPPSALRGRLEVSTPPVVQLDGKTDQLAMGARIRDTRNLLVTSGTLANGQAIAVNYTRDPQGQINEVWVLTAEEAALPRAGASPNWRQRWFGF